jgi:hypothetical protein
MFDQLPAMTQSALRGLANAVNNVLPVDVDSWVISTATLNPAAKTHVVVDQVAKWEGEGRTFLYYFELTSEPSVDLARVEQAYKDARANSARAFARPIRQSNCLYVGGSQNISQRLKGHLGFGAKGTYAMQLAHWAPHLNLTLKFTCARYADTERPEIMQALEDTLWDTLTPMLGRKGKR